MQVANFTTDRRRVRWLSLLLLVLVGGMSLISSASAGGGSEDLISVEIRDGFENQAILVGLIILIGVYVLIVVELVHRTLAAALGGLGAVAALNYYATDSLNLKEVTTMIDWDTIGLLLGMMVMVGVLSHTGVFEWFAVEAYKKSGGKVWTLVVILCMVTAVLSAFLDNVTTMLLLTPVTIQIAKVLDLKPIPILISEVIFSNIGGAATMIGDPPNIIIGNGLSKDAIKDSAYPHLADAGVTFNDFIFEMAPGILMTIIPCLMFVKWMYRDEFAGVRERDILDLERRYGIKDPALLKRSGAVLALVILGFFLHPLIHLDVAWVALIGAVIMLLVSDRHELEEPLEKVEWSTLLFFAGLFVLVHSLQYMGVIDAIGNKIVQGIELVPDDEFYRLVAALVLILWVSAIVSAFIDNIPYTATMVPIVLLIANDLSLPLGPLIWALAFGACLGGNGTLIGASANVVTAGMAEEAGYPISFREFFKAGFPVMLLSVSIVTVYVVAVYAISENMKWILLGITIIGIIMQLSKGRRLGQHWSDALADPEQE